MNDTDAMNKFDEVGFKELLAKAQKKRQTAEHKQAVRKGEEIALICLLLQEAGLNFETGIKDYLAEYFQNSPDELKEILKFYDRVSQVKPSGWLKSARLESFQEGGQNSIWVKFVWKDYKALLKEQRKGDSAQPLL